MIDLRDLHHAPETIVGAPRLMPHPEGGHYREIWRDIPNQGLRGVGTAIQFLLAAGQRSHWHRIDAAELWLWQAGAPLLLQVGTESRASLGPSLAAGERLQYVVPPLAWQSAHSTGRWSLCCCVVTPAFEFAGFELAPSGWEPSEANHSV